MSVELVTRGPYKTRVVEVIAECLGTDVSDLLPKPLIRDDDGRLMLLDADTAAVLESDGCVYRTIVDDDGFHHVEQWHSGRLIETAPMVTPPGY